MTRRALRPAVSFTFPHRTIYRPPFTGNYSPTTIVTGHYCPAAISVRLRLPASHYPSAFIRLRLSIRGSAHRTYHDNSPKPLFTRTLPAWLMPAAGARYLQ
jgi:hypothetical protein